MLQQIIILISGFLVIVSVFPVYQGLMRGTHLLTPTQWFVWSTLSLMIVIAYCNAGAKENVWPAVLGFTNTLVVFVYILRMLVRRHGFDGGVCAGAIFLLFGVAVIGVVWIALTHFYPDSAQYVLYCGIALDASITVPITYKLVTNPDLEGPFSYLTFGLGYGLSMFVITVDTVPNYALPIYMATISLVTAVPLTVHRWKKGIPLSAWREWMQRESSIGKS